MKYYYRCGKPREVACKLSEAPDEIYESYKIFLDRTNIELTEKGALDYSKILLSWEVNHPMSESPLISCPVCGHQAVRLITGKAIFYFRGYGYLDKAGCHRDMDLYKLMNDDPYGHMRPPGDKEEVANRLRKGGKFNPKPKSFVPSSKGGYSSSD